MQGYSEIGFSGKKSIFFVSNPLIMNIVKTATTIFLYKRPTERVSRCLGKISLPKCFHALFSSCISFWQHGRISRFLWNEREFVCPMNIFIAIMLILAVGGLASIGFEQPFVMQNSTVMEVADVVSTFVYRVGLEQANFSIGTAVGLAQSVINFILVLSANAISKRVSGNGIW